MKTTPSLAALFLMAGLAGVSSQAGEIAKPTPAPVVAGSVGGADQSQLEEPAVIDRVVYLAKLPTPDELVKGAALKGTPILRMDQSADRIVVVYQYSGGRTLSFAYTLLSTVGGSNAPVVPSPAPNYSIVTPAPQPPPSSPTVVYADPPVVYYAPRVRYYAPAWDFWTPFTVGIGLGWGFGGHGHGGGWYGGHGGHGGWHR